MRDVVLTSLRTLPGQEQPRSICSRRKRSTSGRVWRFTASLQRSWGSVDNGHARATLRPATSGHPKQACGVLHGARRQEVRALLATSTYNAAGDVRPDANGCMSGHAACAHATGSGSDSARVPGEPPFGARQSCGSS
jgi:hypothetical protein